MYNPSQVLRYLYETQYYRDFMRPQPYNRSKKNQLPSLSNEDIALSVSSSYFLKQLSCNWNLWAPFEQALLHIPPPRMKHPNYETPLGLTIVSQNILGFVYSMAAVMPWLNHPCGPGEYPNARTHAGKILQEMGRLVKAWDLIDFIFYDSKRAGSAVSTVVGRDGKQLNGRQFKVEYGDFWAAWVLMGLMMEWNTLCNGQVGVQEMDTLWKENMGRWMEVSESVDKALWAFGSKKKRQNLTSG
jgi:hypothetical protein